MVMASQVGRNLAPDELALAGISNADLRPRNHAVGVEKQDTPAVARARGATLDPRRHDRPPRLVQREEGRQRGHRGRREDALVSTLEVATDLEGVRGTHAAIHH
jgi:hypothetical protein